MNGFATNSEQMPQPLVRMAADGSILRLVVQGFTEIERSLLEGTVRLSQRRSPRLELLPPQQHDQADVVIVDTHDKAAMAWASEISGLNQKAVVWVDGSQANPGHTLAKRPVQWPILPMLLAKALEAGPKLRTPGAAASAEMAQPASAVHAILVVDDSQAVRAHMGSILERLGYAVEVVSSGQAALSAIAQRRFAMAFMDVLMPELDGYETCKRIKAQKRALGPLPVVMLTSRNSPFDRIRGKMSGCDGYLTKPAENADLMDVLWRFAGKPPQTPEPSFMPTEPAPLESRRTTAPGAPHALTPNPQFSRR